MRQRAYVLKRGVYFLCRQSGSKRRGPQCEIQRPRSSRPSAERSRRLPAPPVQVWQLRGATSTAGGSFGWCFTNKRSAAAQKSAFNRLVRPVIGERSIYDLRRGDIASLFDKIEDTNGPVAADVTLAFIRKAFQWQMTRDQNFVSPIIKGMARTSIKDRARSRVLSDDEICAIWKATREFELV